MVNTIPNRYRADEQLFTLISENVKEAIFLLENNKVAFANKRCQAIFRLSPHELIGLSLEDLVKFLGIRHKDRCLTSEDLSDVTLNSSVIEVHLTSANGENEVLDMKIKPFSTSQHSSGKLIFFRNLTEKIALITETDRLNRISTLGKISSGVAHDLSNLLSIIYLENTKLLLNQSLTEHKESLERIEATLTQAMGIVSRIRDFGKVDKTSLSLIDVNELIDKTIGILKTYWDSENSLQGKKINIVFNPNPVVGNSRILGNLPGLSSVIINLINNAMDAIKEKGEIRINTFSHNGQVFFTLSDNGMGMSEAVQRNIFNIYYSTKKGRGTGLGLFISREILKEHKGVIKVISSPKKGSTFIISLPTVQTIPPDKKRKFSPANNLIFVIEDEKSICTLLCDVFLQAGYKVVASLRREEALQHLKKHKPDLIISDLCIPGMSFHDLADAIKSNNLDIPIILLTGYSSDIDEETRKNLGIREVLPKPFSQKDILQAVERVLNT